MHRFVILAKCPSIFLIGRLLKTAIRCAFLIAISLLQIVVRYRHFLFFTLCVCKPTKLPPCRQTGIPQVENHVPTRNKQFSSKCLFLKHSLTSLPGKTLSCVETQEEELGFQLPKIRRYFCCPNTVLGRCTFFATATKIVPKSSVSTLDRLLNLTFHN